MQLHVTREYNLPSYSVKAQSESSGNPASVQPINVKLNLDFYCAINHYWADCPEFLCGQHNQLVPPQYLTAHLAACPQRENKAAGRPSLLLFLVQYINRYHLHRWLQLMWWVWNWACVPLCFPCYTGTDFHSVDIGASHTAARFFWRCLLSFKIPSETKV